MGGMMHMYSAFIQPMQAEFGWSSSEITAALTLGLFIGALIALTRLQREQEMTAAFAGGMTRWQVIAPAARSRSVAERFAGLS